MNITIRRAMISDAEPIHALCMSILRYQFTLEQVQANVRRLIGQPTDLLLVAERGDEVVGFIHATNHDPVYAPPMKSIVALAVKKEYRHQGLGRKMVSAVEDWARETGASGVRANADVMLDSALTFYQEQGFDSIRTLYNFRKMIK